MQHVDIKQEKLYGYFTKHPETGLSSVSDNSIVNCYCFSSH